MVRAVHILRGLAGGLLLTLLLAGCAWFNPGSVYSPYPYGAGPYDQQMCRDSWGNPVPCDPRQVRDDRRCFNARGTAIFCRPGDSYRPDISGSGRQLNAPPGYPYNLPGNQPIQPPYQEAYRDPGRVDPYGWVPQGQTPQRPSAADDYPRGGDPVFGPATQPPPPGDVWPTPEPAGTGATQRGGFVLGVGDVINVSVFGQPDMATQAVLSDSGVVTMPLIGPINLADLTPAQAEQRIARALQQGEYLVNPQVNVTLEEYRSRQISVVGQVNQPGRITMERDLNVVDAIAQASGTTPDAADFAVLIREGPAGPQRQTLDLRRSLRGPDASNSPRLQDGDTVFVPEAARYYIYGQVNSPAEYPLRPGLTVLQALSIGGGLTELASVNKITIRRRGPDGLLRSFLAKLDDLVKPGDVIFVDEGLF